MCQKCVSSFQKRPWRIRRLVQHCMGSGENLIVPVRVRHCILSTFATLYGVGGREKIFNYYFFLEKKLFSKNCIFIFFRRIFPEIHQNKSVATAVGNFAVLLRLSEIFAVLLRLPGISPCCYGCREFIKVSPKMRTWSCIRSISRIFPEICRWGAFENPQKSVNRPDPTFTHRFHGYSPKMRSGVWIRPISRFFRKFADGEPENLEKWEKWINNDSKII